MIQANTKKYYDIDTNGKGGFNLKERAEQLAGDMGWKEDGTSERHDIIKAAIQLATEYNEDLACENEDLKHRCNHYAAKYEELEKHLNNLKNSRAENAASFKPLHNSPQ
jgi:hypothetical protein